MPTVWRLKDFLATNKITANALAERIRGQISKTSIYNLVDHKDPPTGIHFKTLDVILPALSEITKQEVRLEDILEYTPETPEPAWMRLAGSWDDPDSPGDVSARHDDYLDAAANADHESSVRGER